MAGNHHHNHSPEHPHDFRRNQNALLTAMVIILAVMVAEVAGGLYSGSLALLSDAGHMLTDFFALLLSFLAVRFAAMPATPQRTFGFYRLEILAALNNGMILLVLSAFILYEAWQRFLHPSAVHGPVMVAVAVIGLLANLLAIYMLEKASHENLNIRSAFLHVLGDTLSSVAVIMGGLVIYFYHWTTIDPILSVFIALIILRGSFGLVRESVEILLEATPKNLPLEKVTEELLTLDGVRDVHDLHIWTITSGRHALSAHILIDDLLTSHSANILERINHLLQAHFGIDHTTIQFECVACGEGAVGPCALYRPHSQTVEHSH